MKIIDNYKENRKNYLNSYTFDDRNNSCIVSLFTLSIIFLPVVLMVVELYFLFIMVPYLLAFISFIIALILDFLYVIFRKISLKKIKMVDNLNYFEALFLEILVPDLIILIIYLLGILLFIPKFVM